MSGRTITTIALCGVAALFVLTGVFTSSWVKSTRGESTWQVGLSQVKSCWRGECRTRKLDPDRMRRDEDKVLWAAGRATFLWGVINVLLLGACALLLGLRNRMAHIPARIALFTVILNLLLGAGFVVVLLLQAKGSIKPSPSWSFTFFQLGSIAGIVGAALGWRKLSAVDAPVPGMPMPPQGYVQNPTHPVA